MMIGETHHHYVPPWQESHNNHPTVQITSSPPSSLLSLQSNVPNQLPNSPTYYDAVLASLGRYLDEKDSPTSLDNEDFDFVAEDYDDDFFMYDFKVKKCVRARAHDWTECPFAHPGEKARRRDPRKYNYSGTSCSEFRKGGCKKGDICDFAHGVFECWLHPARFRTQACKDGPGCKRRVCFFAHTPDQLRTAAGLGSPRDSGYFSGSENGAITPATNSPKTIGELVASLKNLQLNKVKSMGNANPHADMMGGSLIYGSPRSVSEPTAVSRAGFFSLPTTPTRPRIGHWDNPEFTDIEDPPVLERVESGRELRVRMFEKLSKENPLEGSSSPLSIPNPGPGPDLGWVSDLIEY